MSPHATPTTSPTTGLREPIFTRDFTLASLANLFTFGSFHILLATLPLYVIAIGANESEVGLVMGSFAITALIVRPFAGAAADEWGRKRFMILGGLGMAIAPVLYIVTTSAIPMIAVRLFQGAAFGTISTCTGALVADIAPASRRGEAVGYYGMSSNISMAAAPALGMFVVAPLGFSGLFVIASSIGLASFVFAVLVHEPARGARPGAEKRPPLIARRAIFPSSILFFFALSYGAVTTFVPLYAIDRGVGNIGLFFTVQAVVVIGMRSVTGKLSDRFGRGAVAIPGLLLGTFSVILLSRASSLLMFLVVAAVFALCYSTVQPSLMAMVIDRVETKMRGAAMGTFMSAMDAGIGIGSVTWGFVADMWDYSHMYEVVALMPLVGIGLYLWIKRHESGKVRQAEALATPSLQPEGTGEEAGSGK